MRLIIDTNRLIAGLLKDSTSRAIILHEMFQFYAPDIIISEIETYKEYLCEKVKISPTDFDIILYTLLENIDLIPYETFKTHLQEAEETMKDVDIKDSPFIAVGLAIKADGIWTEDKHFYKQNKLRVYTTKELIDAIKGTK